MSEPLNEARLSTHRTFRAAAKYAVGDSPDQQLKMLAEGLTLDVPVEVVRLVRELGLAWENVERFFEDALATAEDEWQVYEDAD